VTGACRNGALRIERLRDRVPERKLARRERSVRSDRETDPEGRRGMLPPNRMAEERPSESRCQLPKSSRVSGQARSPYLFLPYTNLISVPDSKFFAYQDGTVVEL